jgi:Uma2 family endonuclease
MAEAVKNLPPMTSDEFLRWYANQPDKLRFELMDGIVYPRRNPEIMQAERLVHARLKARVTFQFANQIRDKKLPCDALGDGMAVRVGSRTTFEPDALVRCGPPLPDNTMILDDVQIVVEVTSPSTERLDIGHKLLRYFRNPKISHYIVVLSEREKGVIHYRRGASGEIIATPLESGIIPLEPPGLTLDIDALFAEP